MITWTWIRNTVRNALRKTFLVKTVLSFLPKSNATPSLCLIAATRLDKEAFWKTSALGQSLTPLLSPTISIDVRFENTDGLPKVYNSAIKSRTEDVLVFLHDDVWIEDDLFVEKIIKATKVFDIVGVAGNRRISKKQPAWLFSGIENNRFVWDHAYLSGSVRHGTPGQSSIMRYGPTPATCRLLDGVLLAAKRSALTHSSVLFDERFEFHFYDLDFCRVASDRGLSLGTWPIDLIHLSGGAFGSESWQVGYTRYLGKWKT